MPLRTLIITILIIACSCTSYSVQPQWIESSTSNQDYWVGIGIINKPFNGDIRGAARNRAIKEISSQIHIDISATMIRIIEMLVVFILLLHF